MDMRRPLTIALVALKLAAGASLSGAVPAAAAVAAPLGRVTPRASVDPHTHYLNRTWIDVLSKPSAAASLESFKVASPLPLRVLAKSGAFLQVASGDTIDDWPFKPNATSDGSAPRMLKTRQFVTAPDHAQGEVSPRGGGLRWRIPQ
jgi:hypothetical protein